MLYSIKDREDLVNLNELVFLQNHVEAAISEDKIGKQNFFEPFTDTVKNNSETLTRTLTEASRENNKALENLNNKLLEIRSDRGMIASYLLSPLSKITNPENTNSS